MLIINDLKNKCLNNKIIKMKWNYEIELLNKIFYDKNIMKNEIL